MDKDSNFTQCFVITAVNPKERLSTLFKSQKFADCTFKIEEAEIKAHKLILACSSPVFEKMFYGDMAQDVIEICDISVTEFNQALEYIYTRSIDIFSVLNAWNLFYMANKYILDDLKYLCLTYIKNHLTMNNVVLSYEFAEMYDLLDIKKECFEDMVNYINGVFYCDYHIKPSTLRHILEEIPSLNLYLLSKIINWGLVECESRKRQISPKNVVDILKEESILNYLKKDCLNVENFQQVDEDLVKETLVLLHDILELSKENSDLIITPKVIPKFCCLRKDFKISCRVDLQQNEEFSSNFSVNKKMIMFGICIKTPMEPPCILKKNVFEGVVSVRICHSDTQQDLTDPMQFDEVIPYNSHTFYLNFNNLAVLEPNTLYNYRISFYNKKAKCPTPLHCYYMSNKLLSKNKESSITFFEINGTIIKGVSFYPL